MAWQVVVDRRHVIPFYYFPTPRKFYFYFYSWKNNGGDIETSKSFSPGQPHLSLFGLLFSMIKLTMSHLDIPRF